MRSLALVLCIALITVGNEQCAATDSIRTVALRGQIAPGTNLAFDWFGATTLNNHGQVAFTSNLAGGSSLFFDRIGIWSSNPHGTVVPVADYGSGGYGEMRFNDRADLVYRYGYSIMSRAANGDTRVVTDSGSYPSLNNSGTIAFLGAVGSESGIVTDSNGSLSLVEGIGPAVNDPQNKEYRGFITRQLNEAGQVLFDARLASPPFDRAVVTTSVYLGDATGAVRRIAGNGDTLMTDRGALQVNNAWSVGMNNAGTALFQVDHYTILAQTGDDLRVVAAEGDSIGDENIFYFGDSALAGNNQVIYQAAMINGNAVPNETFMILKDSPVATPQVVARTGTAAPGAAPGQNFGRFGGVAKGIRTNKFGQVAFGGPLVDVASGEINNYGIWAEDRAGVLKLIVKTGDVIDVDNGPGVDNRTIYSGEFATLALTFGESGGTEGGMPSTFNDRGELVFQAVFTDGSTGIFVSSLVAVPEPVSSTLSVLAGLIPFCSRPRRRTRGGIRGS